MARADLDEAVAEAPEIDGEEALASPGSWRSCCAR